MATAAHTYEKQVDSLMSLVWKHGKPVDRLLSTKQEAKLYQRELNNIQARLRTLKHDVNLAMKEVRLEYEQRQHHIGSHPLLGVIGGKNAARHASTRDREHLKVDRQNALVPYENVIRRIDADINRLDLVKLELDKAIQRGDV